MVREIRILQGYQAQAMYNISAANGSQFLLYTLPTASSMSLYPSRVSFRTSQEAANNSCELKAMTYQESNHVDSKLLHLYAQKHKAPPFRLLSTVIIWLAAYIISPCCKIS